MSPLCPYILSARSTGVFPCPFTAWWKVSGNLFEHAIAVAEQTLCNRNENSALWRHYLSSFHRVAELYMQRGNVLHWLWNLWRWYSHQCFHWKHEVTIQVLLIIEYNGICARGSLDQTQMYVTVKCLWFRESRGNIDVELSVMNCQRKAVCLNICYFVFVVLLPTFSYLARNIIITKRKII